MWARTLDKSRVDHCQQLERDLALVVGSLTGGGRTGKCRQDIRLGYNFESRPLRKGVLAKAGTKIPPQRGPVCQEPRIHGLHHQEHLIVASVWRAIPFISFVEVLPYRVSDRHGCFAVHQQEGHSSLAWVSDLPCEQIESAVSWPSTDDFRHMSLKPRCLEERRPGASEESFELLILVSPAFDENHCPHQRLPPSTPEPQSSPRLYLSSQAFSLPPSSLSNCDSPCSFSQMTKLDG